MEMCEIIETFREKRAELQKFFDISSVPEKVYPDSLKFSQALENAISMLTGMAARIAEIQEQRRWIPVTERLPETVPCEAGTEYSEAIEVWTNGRKVMIAVWNGKNFLCDADYWEAWDETITHWRPLYNLPEELKEGQECK